MISIKWHCGTILCFVLMTSCLEKVEQKHQAERSKVLACSEFLSEDNNMISTKPGNSIEKKYFPVGIRSLLTPQLWQIIQGNVEGNFESEVPDVQLNVKEIDIEGWKKNLLEYKGEISNYEHSDTPQWFLPPLGDPNSLTALTVMKKVLSDSFKFVWSKETLLNDRNYTIEISQGLNDSSNLSIDLTLEKQKNKIFGNRALGMYSLGTIYLSRDQGENTRSILVSVTGEDSDEEIVLATDDPSYKISPDENPTYAKGISMGQSSTTRSWLIGVKNSVELQIGHKLHYSSYRIEWEENQSKLSKQYIEGNVIQNRDDCGQVDQQLIVTNPEKKSPIVPAFQAMCPLADTECLDLLRYSAQMYWKMNRLGENINYGVIAPVPCDVIELDSVQFGNDICSFSQKVYLPSGNMAGLDKLPFYSEREVNLYIILMQIVGRGIFLIDGIDPSPMVYIVPAERDETAEYAFGTYPRDMWFLFDYRARPFHLFNYYIPTIQTTVSGIEVEDLIDLAQLLRAAIMWWPSE